MTYKTFKTVLFAGLIAAMVLPFSGMNSAEAQTSGNSERDAIKSDLENRIASLEGEPGALSTAAEDPEVDKKLKVLKTLKKMIRANEILETSTDPAQKALQMHKLKIYEDKLQRLAGDRGQVVDATQYIPVTNVLADMFPWIQYAYAAQNHYEFTKTIQACGTPEYYSTTSGFIDSTDHKVSIIWSHPSEMRLDGACMDVWKHDYGYFSYYGIDDDTNIYFCSAGLPSPFASAAAEYGCPYASAGDTVYNSAWIRYTEGNNDQTWWMDPISKFHILN